MHKVNSSTHLKRILRDTLSNCFQHMSALATELKHMEITEESSKTKSKEELQIIETMSHILTILNDVIHPAHDVAVSIFKDEDKDVTEFIEYCKKNQQLAIEKKLISHICNCYSCSLKGVK
jgi:hypothetical protein